MIKIAKYHSDFGRIDILQAKDTGSFIYRQGGCLQSECDQNRVSVVPYIHAIFGLLAQKQTADVLMIGGGGGCLATMLDRVGVRVTIVDVNPKAFQIARRYFGLPRHVDCCVANGEDFLRAEHQRYDAIVLDAYVGRRIPEHLKTETFFRLARSHLKSSTGCLIANVHVRHDLDQLSDRFAAKLNTVWRDVRLLDIRGVPDRNAIVMAGKVCNLVPPRLLMPPEVLAGDIAWDLAQMAFRPWHLHRRSTEIQK